MWSEASELHMPFRVRRSALGWKIATIRGIDLRLDFSLIFLLLYVVFVASMTFPAVVQRAGVPLEDLSGSPFVWSVLFALGLLASVVLHEFGHALTAKAAGLKVRGITLMMLGGVSDIEEPTERQPRYFEFRLAIVGPLVSLGLAGIFFLVRRYVSSPEVVFFSFWIGTANLVLGIFNLIPAFPLDGGRALRALLAPRMGKIQATHAAVKISRVIAVALGILGFFGLNFLLMLIAFFIYQAAGMELAFLVSKDLLKGVTVGEVTQRAEPVRDNASIHEAAKRMFDSGNTVLPVQAWSGGPATLLLAEVNRVPRQEWGTRLVSEIMTHVPRSLDVNDSVAQILSDLVSVPAGALPVTEAGRIVGICRYSHLSELVQLRGLIQETGERGRRAA